MASTESCVTIHMVASLDGFIARKDGRVDWLETSDQFEDGDTLDPEFVQEFLKTIDCYVMGSRTYETALDFEAKGFGWSYGISRVRPEGVPSRVNAFGSDWPTKFAIRSCPS